MNPKDMTNKQLLLQVPCELREAWQRFIDEDIPCRQVSKYSCCAEILRRLVEADALRKENEELRKDKERLDWLEKHDVWLDVSGEYDINPLDTAGKSYIQTVRKMIDKTRAKESEASHE